MFLITLGSIHKGYQRFSDDSREKQEIFLCLAAQLSYVSNFCRFPNGGAKILINAYFIGLLTRPVSIEGRLYLYLLHGDHFFSVHSAAVNCIAKMLPFRGKLPTAAC